MIVIWQDKGWVIAAIVFGCSLAANLLTNSLTGSGEYWNQHKWPFAVSLTVAGVLTGIFAMVTDRRGTRTMIDEQTRETVVLTPEHRLFFIRPKYWSVILIVIALAVLVYENMTRG